MTGTSDSDIAPLMSAGAVRQRCGQILAAGQAGVLSHFLLDEGRLDSAADRVIETMRQTYPDLQVPFHSRWRHFVVEGVDRWALLSSMLAADSRECARVAIDLAVTSVLLDAGAGPTWTYRDLISGKTLSRSEGLAIASLEGFASGLFSSDPLGPHQADATGLASVTERSLAVAFQINDANPLEGTTGRVELMNGLGDALISRTDVFGTSSPRIGNLFDYILRTFPDGISAADLLAVVLDVFGSIWPGRIMLNGRNLGDTWRHPVVRIGDESDGLVPFHKLSQWLTYSLIEPLEAAGLLVHDLDGLTGLAEYRNGGLFIDTGVLSPRDLSVLGKRFAPGDEIIVEWRALTVSLLDRIAERVRSKLGRTREDLPLASVLEGGTWAAGRRIASEKREGGAPPIGIAGDGSVF